MIFHKIQQPNQPISISAPLIIFPVFSHSQSSHVIFTNLSSFKRIEFWKIVLRYCKIYLRHFESTRKVTFIGKVFLCFVHCFLFSFFFYFLFTFFPLLLCFAVQPRNYNRSFTWTVKNSSGIPTSSSSSEDSQVAYSTSYYQVVVHPRSLPVCKP